MPQPKVTPLLEVEIPRAGDIALIEEQENVELKPIAGFGEAWVSRCGKILKLHYPLAGKAIYYFATLSTRREDTQLVTLKGIDRDSIKSISQLVARAFLECPEDVERYSLINVDGDKRNNHADNLQWVSKCTTFKTYIEATDTRDGSVQHFDTKKDFHAWVERTYKLKRLNR